MAPSIDKIRLFLPRTGATPDISQYLDNTMERICRATGEVVVSGDIDGLSVYSHSGGHSIIGSLPKFLNGNNIFPLDTDSVRLAFEKMSDALHTSVEEARVTSIEYGANLILRKSPKVYMGKFGNMPRMPIRMVTPNSVYYQTRGEHPSMRFVLYDKGRQVGKRELERYGLGGVNMLRVEDRRNGRLKQQLKVPEVSVAALSFADPRAEDEDIAELDNEVRKAVCYQNLPTKHNLLL